MATIKPRKNYMPGFIAFNWKLERFIKIAKNKMAAIAFGPTQNAQCQ